MEALIYWFLHFCISALASSRSPICSYGLLHSVFLPFCIFVDVRRLMDFRISIMRVFVWIFHVSVSVFLPFCIFVDVRRLSSIFAMFYCLSQMFVDFRKSAFLHCCISALRHFCISALLFSEFLYGSVRIRGCQSIGIRRGRLGWNRETKFAHFLIFFFHLPNKNQ